MSLSRRGLFGLLGLAAVPLPAPVKEPFEPHQETWHTSDDPGSSYTYTWSTEGISSSNVTVTEDGNVMTFPAPKP